jgi:hypothetical protein
MIKVKIKEEYKNKKIYIGGTQYDFSNKTDEQLLLIWEQNPEFRIFLEEVVQLDSEITLNTTEFEEALAKAGIVTSNVTAKRLAAYEKRRKSN